MNTKDLLLKIVEQNGESSSRLTAIETNLKEHMRRTAILEGKTEKFERFMYMTHGIVAFVLSVGTVLALIKYFL